jgi:hypothetical protein
MAAMSCEDERGRDAVAAVGETPAESLKHGRCRRGVRVAPVEDSERFALQGRRLVDRGSVAAARELSGQALGLIPLFAGCRARPFRLVPVQVPDGGARRALVLPASPTDFITHSGADTLASMTANNVHSRAAVDKRATLCVKAPHLRSC